MRFEQIIPLYDDQPIAKRFATQDTRFEVTEGNIHALISETELVELINSGKTMYSGMNDIRVDISGLTANISSLSTAVDANTGNITSLDSRMASYSATLDGLSADLESTKSNLNQTNSRVASLQLSQDTFSTQLSATNTNLSNNYYTKTQVDTKADTAESNAISAAANDATTKANTAQANAIRTAANDATTKANQAIAAANSATDEKLINYSTIESTSSAITQSTTNILSTVSETYSTKTEAQTYAQNAQNNANSATDTKLENYTTISQMNSAIEQSAGRITSTVSQTYATKTEAQSMADDAEGNAKIYADGKVSTAQSQITQTTNAISLRVTNNTNNISSHTDSINTINNTLTSLDTRLDVYDDSIVATVAKKGIISTINQTAESVKINASKINLTGYVTVSSLSTSGATTINGDNITAGTISATRVRGGYLSVGGSAGGSVKNGIFRVYDENDNKIIQIDTNGIRVGNIESSMASPNTTITPGGYVQTNRLRATGSIRAIGDPGATEKSHLVIPVVNTYETTGANCYFEVGENGTTIKTLYESVAYVPGLSGVRGCTLKAGGILQRGLDTTGFDYLRKTVGGYVCVDTDSMTTTKVTNYTRLSPTELVVHSVASDREVVISSEGIYTYLKAGDGGWGEDTYISFRNKRFTFLGSGRVTSSFTAGGDIGAGGDLTVNGTKSRAVETDNYADRLLYCYETASPLFGDVGEGTINEDGECYIFIDPILMETIQTTQYQIFLQKYGNGDCWINERKADHFVVMGTPNMTFGWELKAKQFDFTQRRLDKLDKVEHNFNNINYASEAESHIIEILNERMKQNEDSDFSNYI